MIEVIIALLCALFMLSIVCIIGFFATAAILLMMCISATLGVVTILNRLIQFIVNIGAINEQKFKIS